MAISFNYDATMRQVSEMKHIASEMRTIANNDMPNTVSQIRASWKGDSSTVFCSKYNMLGEKIRAEATNIDNMADTLDRLAKSIKAAEERAEAILAERRAAEAAAKANT